MAQLFGWRRRERNAENVGSALVIAFAVALLQV